MVGKEQINPVNNKLEGQLIITRKVNALNMIEGYDFRWEGGPTCIIGLCSFSGSLIKWIKPDIAQIGPYRLKLIERDYIMDRATLVRLDFPFWWFIVFSNKMTHWLDLIYRRTIITMAVWKLANYDGAILPSWHNIKIFRKTNKKKKEQ